MDMDSSSQADHQNQSLKDASDYNDKGPSKDEESASDMEENIANWIKSS